MFWHTTNKIAVPPRLDSSDYELYKQLPKGILIFDTLRASHTKDENESKDMAAIMNRLKEIRDCGFTVVVLHHTAKANNKDSKGSTAISDLSDQVLSLAEVPHVLNGKFSKKENQRPCWCRGLHYEGDEEVEPKILRLGTQGKTRYMPFQIFMEFEGSSGVTSIKTKGLLDSLRKRSVV
jgi:hypothetical protein